MGQDEKDLHLPKTKTVDLPGGETMDLVWIEPGTFTMGSPDSDSDRGKDEGPQHQVTISKGFYLGECVITCAQWEAVMGDGPWRMLRYLPYVAGSPDDPAVLISWEDVQKFIQELNSDEGEAIYRLPTEAEWEYACRAGTTTRWSFGDDEGELGKYAWYSPFTRGVDRRKKDPLSVRSLLPNPWGLYDMHGNVWEWCQDLYGDYSRDCQVDPTVPESGPYRVYRGGSHFHFAQDTRSANRGRNSAHDYNDTLGARLLMTK